MGGHGGLNILPQKRWNVYNYENREKVRKDEEAAAKEEQLKQEQVRKRDAEFRLEQLRAARGLAPVSQPVETPASQPVEPAEMEKNPGHINLFEGIRIFDPVEVPKAGAGDERDGFKRKKMKKEEAPKLVTAEDEKYRLGYGLAGKGVKLPWYLEKRGDRGDQDDGEKSGDEGSPGDAKEQRKKSGKKTLEELREERLKREKQEKERARRLMLEKNQRNGALPKDRYIQRS